MAVEHTQVHESDLLVSRASQIPADHSPQVRSLQGGELWL